MSELQSGFLKRDNLCSKKQRSRFLGLTQLSLIGHYPKQNDRLSWGPGLSDKTFPGERQHTHLLIPSREPQQTKVQIPPKSSLVSQWIHWQEDKFLQESCVRKAHPNMGDSSGSWEPGSQSTACRQLSRLKSIPSRDLACPNRFQAAGMVFAALLGFIISFYCFLWQRGASWIWSVAETSWSSFDLFTCLWRRFL